MMRQFAWGVVGAVALLLGAELLLRLLPVSTASLTGYHVDPMILSYPPHHQWRVASGWDLRNSRNMRANNLGFAADIDFVPDASAIGMIGDSYVEAGMLDEAARPAAQLSVALQRQRKVYALGGPGSALLDYAERIRFASERLGVRDFVVLMEPGDVRQALCGSGNVHGPCLDRHTLQPRIETLPGPSLAKQVLRHCALAQYIVGQLKVDGARLAGQMFPGLVAAPAIPDGPSEAARQEQQQQRAAMVAAVTEEFFSRIKPYASGRLVFVVDGRRNAGAAATPLMQERDAFIAAARQHGASVVDAEPLYLRHLERSRLSLSVSPGDGHLNALGVGLLMQATAAALQ